MNDDLQPAAWLKCLDDWFKGKELKIKLLKSFMRGWINPDHNYSVLTAYGYKKSGKSTLAYVLNELSLEHNLSNRFIMDGYNAKISKIGKTFKVVNAESILFKKDRLTFTNVIKIEDRDLREKLKRELPLIEKWILS